MLLFTFTAVAFVVVAIVQNHIEASFDERDSGKNNGMKTKLNTATKKKKQQQPEKIMHRFQDMCTHKTQLALAKWSIAFESSRIAHVHRIPSHEQYAKTENVCMATIQCVIMLSI